MIEEKVGDIIYSHIEITDGSYHKKYIFSQDLWKYKEFTRLKDLRKYINTIKKDLIGKTLDKVLFLNDLDNDIYIFKNKMWHSYNEKTKEITYTYEPYWEDVAEPPIVLQFEGNNLEIDVSEDAHRSFDGPNYVRLGYNTIKDVEKIEKRFKGVNHSVRFKEIIGKKLIEIITENRCNHIEFKFENGYGCCIHTDTCGDYGTEFHIITPEEYARIPHRVCAYKEKETSDWIMEILRGEQSDKKFIKAYYKDKYKYWMSPISLKYPPDMLEKQNGDISSFIRYLLFDTYPNSKKWFYIGDTNKFYKIDEIVPEPNKKSKELNIKVKFNVEYNRIESYFDRWIDKDYLSYDIYNDFELITEKRSIKPNIGHGSIFRCNIKKFIKYIENNIPSVLYYFQTQQDILFAYPKNDKLRIVIRSGLFEGAKYIFDCTTDKNDFIKQLKRELYLMTRIQYSVNKRIKEYKKEHNL